MIKRKLSHKEKSTNSHEKLRKRRKLDEFNPNDFSYVIDSQWVPISKTRNASLKDYCLDFFELFNIRDIDDKPIRRNNREQKKVEKESFLNFLFSKGNEFERTIIEQIRDKFPFDFVKIGESYEAKEVKKYKDTLNAMKRNIPIIYQGVLHNTSNKTYGSVDLIVRTDFLKKLMKNEPIYETKNLKKSDNINDPKDEKGFEFIDLENNDKISIFPYCVIDIKWSQIHFNSNMSTIRNSLNVKPFKTQVILYNLALSEAFQRVNYMKNVSDTKNKYPLYCYILGKGWLSERTQNKEKIVRISEDPFDRLGVIDIEDNDNEYVNIADDAVRWYRQLINSKNWSINPPSNSYLYPNMSNTLDHPYHFIKKQMADRYFEITDIWQCGVGHREYAMSQDIKSWNDPDLNSETLGITGKYTKNIVDKILEVNRGEYKDIIHPKKFNSNDGNWKDTNLKLYIDFETISGLFFDHKEKDYKEEKDHKGEKHEEKHKEEKHKENYPKPIAIYDEIITQRQYKDVLFMIGLGIRINNEYRREKFILEDLTLLSRRQLVISFIKRINEILNENRWGNKEIPIFHFGSFEKYTFSKTLKVLDINLDRETIYELKFIDLNNTLKRETFVIKGSLNYGLKSIIKAMNKLGLTNLKYDSKDNDTKDNEKSSSTKITNGEDCMFMAWKYYTGNIRDKTIIELVDKYNGIDCEALDEIMMKIMVNRK